MATSASQADHAGEALGGFVGGKLSFNRLKDAQEDLGQAKDDAERTRLEREIAIAEAQIQAAGG